MYDLIVIGGGPAAITAGIYGARRKLKTLLITKDWNGQVSWTAFVENYPGFESISGPELVDKLVSHLKKTKEYGLEIKKGFEVKEVGLADNDILEIKADSEVYQSKALVIATGRRPKKLGVPGEDKFTGKGVSYCPICDAPLFKDKAVAVVGGGNAGFEAALDLTKYASKIYLLEFAPKLSCDECFVERLEESSKTTILTNVLVKEIKGKDFVESLVYQDRNSKETKEISVEGVFVEIGSVPNSSLVENMVELNEEGEIKIDLKNTTSRQNVFAAGDVTDVSHKQIIIAAGEGAKAALNAYDYIKRKNNGQ
jgi:thioredoxin-disulfide reductase